METNKVPLTPYLLIAATFIGLGDTLYLAYYHLLGIIPGCALKGCEIVLSSPYSSPLGVPFAYLGVIFYVHVLALAVFLAVYPNSRGLSVAALAYTLAGFVLSIVFELFQYFVIGAMCLYCGISAFTTLLLFGIALWHWKTTKVDR